jgi:hypothetical protein
MTAEHQDALWHVLDDDELSHGPGEQGTSENTAQLHKQLQGMLARSLLSKWLCENPAAFKSTDPCCKRRR